MKLFDLVVLDWYCSSVRIENEFILIGIQPESDYLENLGLIWIKIVTELIYLMQGLKSIVFETEWNKIVDLSVSINC